MFAEMRGWHQNLPMCNSRPGVTTTRLSVPHWVWVIAASIEFGNVVVPGCHRLTYCWQCLNPNGGKRGDFNVENHLYRTSGTIAI